RNVWIFPPPVPASNPAAAEELLQCRSNLVSESGHFERTPKPRTLRASIRRYNQALNEGIPTSSFPEENKESGHFERTPKPRTLRVSIRRYNQALNEGIPTSSFPEENKGNFPFCQLPPPRFSTDDQERDHSLERASNLRSLRNSIRRHNQALVWAHPEMAPKHGSCISLGDFLSGQPPPPTVSTDDQESDHEQASKSLSVRDMIKRLDQAYDLSYSGWMELESLGDGLIAFPRLMGFFF
ncbi:hypothetical protein QTP70_025762, partial [Hemibagrus guttatus]